MPRLALLLLLGLAACSSNEAATSENGAPVPMRGWRTEHGKVPTQAEFTALAATCEARGGSLDSCLTDMGLRRSQ
jgi:hypothetical protein